MGKSIGIKKVKNVWGTKNKIENPRVQENLLEAVEQVASLFSPDEYYYFVFNFDSLDMQFVSEGIKDVLGVDPNSMNLDFFFENLHPEDVEKIHEKENVGFDFLLNHISSEDIPSYKVIYLLRLKHKDGSYRMVLHQSRTINVSNKGRVQQILCVHSDVTHLKLPMDHSMSFVSSTKPSFYAVSTTGKTEFVRNNFSETFTKKQKEIIQEITNGNSVKEIAKLLNLSPHTINTHKRNILKKSNCKNTAELIARCIREGVI